MAKIVLGIGSSHAPQLEMPPQNWLAYAAIGRKAPVHWYQGKTYSFDELVEARRDQHFERECTDEKFQARWDACQRAIGHLGETLDRVSPDVCIILGDDQHESFHDDNMPSIAIYNGATVDDAPVAGQHRATLSDPVVANAPPTRATHPTDAALGNYLIEALIEEEFDVARSSSLPAGNREGTI